jgi:DNA-binding MarR family transcriptional regulator
MPNREHEMHILEALEQQPDTTQAGLAAQLGVAVGTVNWYLKRLIKKGYVKTKQLERRNLKYFVTPAGLALKARLTREYMEVSLRVYRELRRAAKEALARVRDRGYDAVRIVGDGAEGASLGGALDILRLTSLEQGIGIDGSMSAVPCVRADGRTFTIVWPDGADERGAVHADFTEWEETRRESV